MFSRHMCLFADGSYWKPLYVSMINYNHIYYAHDTPSVTAHFALDLRGNHQLHTCFIDPEGLGTAGARDWSGVCISISNNKLSLFPFRQPARWTRWWNHTQNLPLRWVQKTPLAGKTLLFFSSVQSQSAPRWIECTGAGEGGTRGGRHGWDEARWQMCDGSKVAYKFTTS